ncbi:MAG: phosphoribosylformylglycinamidine synthase subunit PurL [Myxococcota bacterium]
MARMLERDPTLSELHIFAIQWSEHCSYKSSRVHLSKFPTVAPWVLQGPGENAGIIDIGEGLAVVFKMESHNHPSYIEPYQGAATGVGGILRDVFTMGARPIANLNSLRFGSPDHPRTPHLLRGVVKGIGDYGNCVGIPTVGGEVVFDKCYDGNCLVNAFTLGILKSDRIFRGYAGGPGNPVIYVGSKTGRDGIHGATMASAEFNEDTEEKRPTVQVGDPFTEKLLFEACLELMKKDLIVGIQDMGAAGLTSSSSEMAGRAGTGVEIELDLVPLREDGMTPYEIMLSESQERMLMVVKEGSEDEALDIFRKWDLDAVVIGKVTSDGYLRAKWRGRTVVEIPAAKISSDAPKYNRPMEEPTYYKKREALDESDYKQPQDLAKVFKFLIAHPNVAHKSWVYEQYDHTVRDQTIMGPATSDAAILRIIEAFPKGIGLTVDCNSRYAFLDPYEGGKHAVAECARNLSCAGVTPRAITDCLNFGNPEKPEIMWQFAKAIEGIADACYALETPVVSGNVSFYNETEGVAIYPTPTVAMVGVIDDFRKAVPSAFPESELLIGLLGKNAPKLSASGYLDYYFGAVMGRPPKVDLKYEARFNKLLLEMIGTGEIKSAHDAGDGGLAVAIAESCLKKRGRHIGADIAIPYDGREDILLFGECGPRVILSFPPPAYDALFKLAERANIPFRVIGKTGGDSFKWAGLFNIPLSELAEPYFTTIEKISERTPKHSRGEDS